MRPAPVPVAASLYRDGVGKRPTAALAPIRYAWSRRKPQRWRCSRHLWLKLSPCPLLHTGRDLSKPRRASRPFASRGHRPDEGSRLRKLRSGSAENPLVES